MRGAGFTSSSPQNIYTNIFRSGSGTK
jgi:hypothetical protein